MTGWQRTDAGLHLAGRVNSSTQPEVTLRKRLHAHGLRYRLHLRVAGFRPDIVFPGPHVAVFVDGCYWHGCPEHGPKDFRGPNADLWTAKLTANRERDRRADTALSREGWLVVRIWECTVRREPDGAAAMVADLVAERCRALRGQAEGRAPRNPQVAEGVHTEPE